MRWINSRRNCISWYSKILRVSRWRKQETGLTVEVAHFPPGTSKWNKIEHRLFSYISKNWRGKPLVTYQVIVSLIAGTKTKKGLNVACEIDDEEYKTGMEISDEQFADINIWPNKFHGEWN